MCACGALLSHDAYAFWAVVRRDGVAPQRHYCNLKCALTAPPAPHSRAKRTRTLCYAPLCVRPLSAALLCGVGCRGSVAGNSERLTRVLRPHSTAHGAGAVPNSSNILVCLYSIYISKMRICVFVLACAFLGASPLMTLAYLPSSSLAFDGLIDIPLLHQGKLPHFNRAFKYDCVFMSGYAYNYHTCYW